MAPWFSSGAGGALDDGWMFGKNLLMYPTQETWEQKCFTHLAPFFRRQKRSRSACAVPCIFQGDPAFLRDYQTHHDFGDGALAIKITQLERKVI